MQERAEASRSRRGPHLIVSLAADPGKLVLQTSWRREMAFKKACWRLPRAAAFTHYFALNRDSSTLSSETYLDCVVGGMEVTQDQAFNRVPATQSGLARVDTDQDFSPCTMTVSDCRADLLQSELVELLARQRGVVAPCWHGVVSRSIAR
jgi:hypothetical protein